MRDIELIIQGFVVLDTFDKVRMHDVVEANGYDVCVAGLDDFRAFCGKNSSIDEYF